MINDTISYDDFINLINISWKSFIKNKTNINIINNFMKNIKKVYTEYITSNNDNMNQNLDWIYKTCRMSVYDLV